MNDPVYLVGARYRHHAGRSGYDGVSHLVGTTLKSPLTARFFTSYYGWRLDAAITTATSRRYYSLSLLLAELTTALHMASRRNALYHVLYGDTDLWLLGPASRVTKNYLVATFHEPAANLEYLRIDQDLVGNLDAAVLVSESQRSHFEQLLPPDRIFVVPHGVDTDFFRPTDQPSRKPICITVGAKHRDFDTLGQAFRAIRTRNPEARLIAVGTRRGRGPDPQLQLDDPNVEYLDGISDEELRRAYGAASVAVLSLQGATANNALLEAMASGLPVVATDVGGIREYLGDEAGVLCAPSDAEGLARQVLRILNDSQVAARMAMAARVRAFEFDFRRVAGLLREAHSKVVSRASSRW